MWQEGQGQGQSSVRTQLVGDAVLAPLPAGRGFAAAARVRLRALPVHGGGGSAAHSKPAPPKHKADEHFEYTETSHKGKKEHQCQTTGQTNAQHKRLRDF